VTSAVSRGELSLRTPLVVSALLHLVVVAAFLVSRASAPVATPPTYRVELVAAPPGPRQIGVVRETPPDPVPTPPAPTPLSRETPQPERMKAPTKAPPTRAPKVATPNAGAAPTKAAPAPRAGGGPVGGRGADVANVRTEGTEFPYPVYLQNVVRQIALQFKPSGNGALRAEVAFLIRRDGSISGLKLVTRSGAFSFDQDAMGAVEAAARANAFGPLPQGFTDDVLPVIFSFDPRLIR
jgi:periplasmic protein TonB